MSDPQKCHRLERAASPKDDQFIVECRDGRVLFLTLSRPEVLNACTADEHDEMAEIWRKIAADDTVDVVVVTGAGRAFSVSGHLDLYKDLISDAATRAQVQHARPR